MQISEDIYLKQILYQYDKTAFIDNTHSNRNYYWNVFGILS